MERHHERGGQEREADRSEGVRLRDRGDVRGRALPQSLGEDRRQREKDEEAEERECGSDEGAADGGPLGQRRRRAEATARGHGRSAGAPPRPALESVRGEDEGEGREEKDDRDRRGAGLVELLELRDDQERRDLGLHRKVARDEDDRSVFPQRAREREREPREERREDVREDDPEERLEARRPQDSGGLLELGVEVLEDGLDGAHDERQADERQREDDAGGRESHLQAERLEEPADPAVPRVERRERETGDGRREREREVHERVEDRAQRGARRRH